jgi:hypothetical protein
LLSPKAVALCAFILILLYRYFSFDFALIALIP